MHLKVIVSFVTVDVSSSFRYHLNGFDQLLAMASVHRIFRFSHQVKINLFSKIEQTVENFNAIDIL